VRQRTLIFAAALALCAPVQDVRGQAAPTRLTVADAEGLAHRNNPRVTIARLDALASAQTTREVKSALYPSLAANLTGVAAHQGGRVTAGGLNNPVIYDRAAGGLVANQLITDFGRTSNLVATSELRAQAEDERAMATTAQILLAADRAFYGALGAQALLRVAQQTVAARRDVADRVQALADSKLKSDLDASFAQVNLAEGNLLLLDAESNEKAARADLSAVLGFSDLQNFELVDENSASVAPPADVEFLVAEALSRRPEVAALDLDARAAEKFHLAEKDLQLPNIRAAGVVGGAPYRNDILSPWYGAIGINVEIPIFNGFLFGARSAESDLRARAARERLNDLKNTVARDVRTSWLDASAAYARLAVSRRLLEQANLALSLAKTRYDLGLSSIVELSQAQLQQTRAEIDDTEARYRYLMAEASLRYQVGVS
jgi:outer membrane protein